MAQRSLRGAREVSKYSQTRGCDTSFSFHVACDLNEAGPEFIILRVNESTARSIGTCPNSLPSFAGLGLVLWMPHNSSYFGLAMSKLALETIATGTSFLE